MISFSAGVRSRCPTLLLAARLFSPSRPSAVDEEDPEEDAEEDEDNELKGDPVQAASARSAANATIANDVAVGRDRLLTIFMGVQELR